MTREGPHHSDSEMRTAQLFSLGIQITSLFPTAHLFSLVIEITSLFPTVLIGVVISFWLLFQHKSFPGFTLNFIVSHLSFLDTKGHGT